jgi:enoyl-CoA hydratase
MSEERPSMLRELRDGVAILSFNRPEKHNAGAGDPEAWEWALRDPNVRAVVIRGEGKSFHTGRDTTLLGTRASGQSDLEFVRHATTSRVNQLMYAKPIIAAVKGYAIGGGFEQALSADIRVGSREAKVCLAEIKYGILPDTGGTQMLTALVGPARAKYMTLTADFVDARTAYDWGIFDFLMDTPEECDAKAIEIATTIASRSPAAVEMGKQLIDQMYVPAIINGVRQELLAQSALFQTGDYKEQRAALRENREPVFNRT